LRKKKEDGESSSSGDYNIWGEEQEEENSCNSDRERESDNSQNSLDKKKSQQEIANYNQFSRFFNSVRKNPSGNLRD
jgi:hypothetical protein